MFRVTPTSLTLAGPPGIGKSFLLASLVKKLNKLCNLPPTDFYSRNIYVEHWDGFDENNIIIYDDVHVDCMSPLSVTYKEIIALISCTPFQPPFAQLELKGTKVHPRFVLFTTNHPYPQYPCDRVAIQRRHGTLVYCIPNGKQFSPDFSHVDFYMHSSPICQSFTSHDYLDPNLYNSFSNFQRHPAFIKSIKVSIEDIVSLIYDKSVNEQKHFNNVIKQC